MNDDGDDKNMKTKDRIAKYKELLKSIEEKEKQENEEKIDVEVTWEPGKFNLNLEISHAKYYCFIIP